MNTTVMKLIALLVVTALLTVSCGLPPAGTALTADQRSSAQKSCIAQYTAGGAVLGGLLGAALGGRHSWGTGAAVGAAAGGALAFLIAWGKCMEYYSDLASFPVAGAAETAQRVGYTDSQGYVTKIENFNVTPNQTAPGKAVQMDGSYYVMAPKGTKEVKVTETRSVAYLDGQEWKDLGSIPQDVTSQLGTRNAKGSFDLPADVPEGRYRMTMRVAANGKEDAATREIIVKKGLAGVPVITIVASR
ncbi:MAG TPA: hypothetical protein VK445_01780 [Dissulfurispiraceae bacterium]|nr:hypothetical protein [Dissulfurispiraceae bacterium]